MSTRFSFSIGASRLRAAATHAGVATLAIALLVAVIVTGEVRMTIVLAVPIVLAYMFWRAPAAAALSGVLCLASMAALGGSGHGGHVLLYLAAVWGAVFWASRVYEGEVLGVRLLQERAVEDAADLMKVLEKEQEGARMMGVFTPEQRLSELTAILDEERKRIGGLRQRIEKILMLTGVANDLSSTLDLRVIVESVLSRTQEISAHHGETKLVLFDDAGHRGYRLADGVVMQVIEDEGALDRWVRERKIPLVVPDVRKDQRVRGAGLEAQDVASLMAVPLVRGTSVFGVLHVRSREANSFTPDDGRVLSVLADLASVAVQNAMLYQRTQVEAITDGLTEVYVHRYFRERLNEEVKRAREGGHTFCLMMADIDNFKSFNDTYGHLVGDSVLRAIARILREGVRGTDLVARYGGEEFAVLLVETGQEPGRQVADRLRAAVEALATEELGAPRKVTISVGLACFPGSADDERHLIERADEALYAAKRQGKNQVVVSEGTP